MNGIGAHEVIIETPDHDMSLADLPPDDITDVLITWRSRILDLRRDFRFRYMILFKNHGARAGATLSHSHSQLIAVPLLPPVAATELKVCRNHYAAKERCLFCDVLAFELKEGTRVVREFSNFVTLAPYAASFPFELRLYPKRHAHDFALMNDAQLAELAVALKDMLLRIKVVLKDASYNFILHTSPPCTAVPASLRSGVRWNMTTTGISNWCRALPQLPAFEWGTGFFINPHRRRMLPVLREAVVSSTRPWT